MEAVHEPGKPMRRREARPGQRPGEGRMGGTQKTGGRKTGGQRRDGAGGFANLSMKKSDFLSPGVHVPSEIQRRYAWPESARRVALEPRLAHWEVRQSGRENQPR